MQKHLVLSALALVGTALLAGCGVAGPSSASLPSHHQTTAAGRSPSQSRSTPSSTAASPSTPPTPSAAMAPSSSSSSSASVSASAPPTTPTVTTPTTAAPVVTSYAGTLQTNTAWPLQGATVTKTVTSPSMTIEHLSRAGFVIDGVHWTWPRSDTNPDHYLVVPAVVGGKPYLVWTNLGAETGTEGDPNPNQPATLSMTPWNPAGGSLATQAIVLTNDIPPVWSRSDQWNFAGPADNPADNIRAMAENAWTGWFQWGRVTKSYIPPKGPTTEPRTVAWPIRLDPADNGVVLVVETHLAGANQGFSANVYYLNLVRHTVTGLASLSNGGSLFLGLGIWNGLVVDGETMLNAPARTFLSTVVAYNEVTGQRESIPWPDTTPPTFSTMVGQQLFEPNGTAVATIHASISALYGPTPNPFSSSSWTYASFTNHGPDGSFTVSIPQQFTAQAPPTDHDGRTWTHGSAKVTAFSVFVV